MTSPSPHPMMHFGLEFSWNPSDIAFWLNGHWNGVDAPEISGFAALDQAGPTDLSFLDQEKRTVDLQRSEAGLVLVSSHLSIATDLSRPLIVVDDAKAAMIQLLEKLAQQKRKLEGTESGAVVSEHAKVHPSARIEAGAVVQEGVVIEADVLVQSGAVIGAGVIVGSGSIIGSGVKLLASCRIGKHCIIQSNTVVGSDGFGYVKVDTGLKKIPHLGSVVIEDHVEIGANCTIDQGMLSPTRIKEGAKLDNLVHIAHNVIVGAHTVIAAQTGVAGSVVIGSACRIGGQVGFVDGIHIADGVEIAAQSGVMNSIEQVGAKVWGSPAMPAQQFRKSFVLFRRLPELVKAIGIHEK